MSEDIKYAASLFIGQCMPIPSPVFWDPHTSIYNKGLPVTVITGSPGTGKTFATQIITAQDTIKGKTVIALDYKGDLLKLVPLESEFGTKIRVWDISAVNQSGVFDPFNLTNDPSEQLSLTIELITLLLGEMSREDRAAVMPVIRDVIEEKNPSLYRCTMVLRQSQDPRARGVGNELNNIRGMQLARLCFYSGKVRKTPPSITASGLTIATLAGLDLPESPEEGEKTAVGRLASGIMFLLTDYVRRMLKETDPTQPKLVVVDEAWAIMNTEPGKRIIKEVALLGRSRNVATVLTTQSPKHFEEVGISNTIGTRFMFEGSMEDAELNVPAAGLPEGEQFEDLLCDLPKYACVMAGWEEDFALMKFSTWRKNWVEAFRTNPYDHMMEVKRERDTKRAEAAAQQ